MRGKIITREEMLAIPAVEISDLSQMPSEPLGQRPRHYLQPGSFY